MHKSEIAERILTLVMMPSRAAPIVGDLMEDALTRGDLWFWINVMRAAFAFLLRQFATNASHLASLALRGLAIVVAVNSLYYSMGLPWLVKTLFPGGYHQSNFKLIIFLVVGVAARILVPFCVGLWIARRAAGHELAACLGLTIAANVGRILFVLVGNYYSNFHLAILELGFPYFLSASVLAAIITRRRALLKVQSP